MGVGLGQGQVHFDQVGGAGGGGINLTLSGNTAGAGALMSSGTVSIAGGNNITLSQAGGNAFTISGANTHRVTLAGNSTSAGAGFIEISSGTMTLAGGNNITLSQNGNAITISAFTQTVQTQNRFNLTLSGNSTSAGAGFIEVSSGTMTLAGGNNVTLSQNGNAITISAFNQSVQTQNRFNMTLAGNSTSAGAGFIEISSGTLTLAGGNNVTLSQNGNAVTIIGAGGGGGGATNSLWYNESGNNLIGISNASISLFPIALEAALNANKFEVFINASGSTASTNSLLISAAIYTFVNSTSIGTATTGSFATSWTSGTNATNNWGGHIGLRRWDIPMTINATPGQYVVALWIRSSQANGTFQLVAGFTPAAFSGRQGQISSATHQKLPFLGLYTSSTSVGFPAGIPQVSVIGSASLGKMIHIGMRSDIGTA